MDIYLDNSATTRPCEAAVGAMLGSMREGYFNPSALYRQAVEAERAMEAAREAVARPVGMDGQSVIFTSGGTESDNLAILGTLCKAREKGDVLYTAAEHPAVKNACLEAAALYGHTAREIPLTAQGTVDLDALAGMLGGRTLLVCVMQVCNETGVVMPLGDVVRLRDRLAPQAAIHVDGVQGYLRCPFAMRDLGVQSYAISAHKVHGPKGVGALLCQKGHKLHPLMVGGGQQQGMRSGTENTVSIAGFAAAVKAYPPMGETQQQLAALKHAAVDTLTAVLPTMRLFGGEPFTAASAPHILYAAFAPVRAETLVHALEEDGIMVGTGSACSSRKHKRSEVLSAMGIPPALIDSSIRLSFSITNTVEEVRYAAERIAAHYQLLARFTRR